MKKSTVYLFVFVFFFVPNLNAQSDTLYLTKDRDTCFKKEAYFTRVLKREGNGIAMVEYFQNGKIHLTGTFDVDSPEIRQGYYKSFHENGLLYWEGNFINDKEDGVCKTYWESGVLRKEEEYSNGKNNGTLKTYFKSGANKRIEHYKNGEFVDGKCFATTGADTAFYPFRENPEFVGGEAKMYKFINKHIKYPLEAVEANVQGISCVYFVVDTDGSLKDVKVKKRCNQYLDAEAIRVISLMPNWKPGKEEGEIVKTYFRLPITFSLR